MKIPNKIEKFYNKYKCALYSSFIFTFLTHFYYFSKRLSNEDDLSYLLFNDSALTSGRWSKGILFSTSIMSPPLKFILAIIVLGIVSVLICDIFKIKNKKQMILISLIISTFPTLALSFSFLFMVEVYLTSLLCATIAVWLFDKYKYGYLFGGIFLALSLGNYQSYISIATSLIVIYLIKMIIDKKDTKSILKMALKALVMGIIGVTLYFIILKVILHFNNTVLSSYKGADSMGIPPLAMWPTLLFRTYKHFIGYFIGLSYYKVSLIEAIVRISTILLSLIMLIKKVINKSDIKHIILLLIIIMLLPLIFNIVDFVAYKAELTSLQIYPFVMLYILCVVLLDNKKSIIFNSLIMILLITVCGFNFISTNQYYFKLEKYHQYTVRLNNRILNRIEMTEGFNYDMPVMFVGNENQKFKENLYSYPDLKDNLTFDQPLWGGKYIGYADLYSFHSDAKLFKMFNNEFGIYLKRATKEERDKVKNSREYKEMKYYPDINSIKVIKGVLVVNF